MSNNNFAQSRHCHHIIYSIAAYSVATIDFKDHALWQVRDEHDMVNIDFHVDNVFRMITHAKPFVNIEYFVAFGTLYGYVRDEDGKKYVLDGMMGMGEDKDLLL